MVVQPCLVIGQPPGIPEAPPLPVGQQFRRGRLLVDEPPPAGQDAELPVPGLIVCVAGHVQAGGPLHADVTAFLLARGADPLLPFNGVPVFAEAEIRGHWLAAEIMRAWIKTGSAGRDHQPGQQ